MTPTEQTTVGAFLLALSQLESPLPPELQTSIRQVGSDLQREPKTAVAEIPALVQQNAELENRYRTARQTLQGQYQTQERDKLLWNGSEAVAIEFEDFAGQMLAAADFKTAMKQWVQRAKNSDNAFANALKTAVSLADARAELEAVSVLQALEFHPLTMENLAYRLNLPEESVRRIVRCLWDEGKVDTVTGGILRKVFPFLRSRSFEQVADSAYLTLTSLGHFRLHPVISFSA